MAGKGIRDWILFFVFAGVPIVSFWLQDYPDTPFFSGMLVIFLVVLLWIKQYHKDAEFVKLVDYDENLQFDSFLWIALGVVATFLASSYLVKSFGVTSTIWIPQHNLQMNYGSFQLSGFWNDVLFQLVLVAPAEELCKLSLHLAFYLKLKASFDEGIARIASIVAPIFFWAMLHVYRAYTGSNMVILLFSAFVGGIIIFAVMYKTRSLMAAIMTHAGYNILVLWIMQSIV
jgi:membrane protease YdiL (CAAX protease family)